MVERGCIGTARAGMKTASLIDELEGALAGGTNAQRITMLARVTDLFVEGADQYSAEHVNIFVEVMVKLTATIEAKARAKLSSRLAPIPNAPHGVVRMLAFDDNIEVAHPVLTASDRLDEADLVANASHKSQQHLAAIAQRRWLSEAVTDVLVTAATATSCIRWPRMRARVSPMPAFACWSSARPATMRWHCRSVHAATSRANTFCGCCIRPRRPCASGWRPSTPPPVPR